MAPSLSAENQADARVAVDRWRPPPRRHGGAGETQLKLRLLRIGSDRRRVHDVERTHIEGVQGERRCVVGRISDGVLVWIEVSRLTPHTRRRTEYLLRPCVQDWFGDGAGAITVPYSGWRNIRAEERDQALCERHPTLRCIDDLQCVRGCFTKIG